MEWFELASIGKSGKEATTEELTSEKLNQEGSKKAENFIDKLLGVEKEKLHKEKRTNVQFSVAILKSL